MPGEIGFFDVIYWIISKMLVRYTARAVRQNAGYSKILREGFPHGDPLTSRNPHQGHLTLRISVTKPVSVPFGPQHPVEDLLDDET